jgi:hypothetical protein
MEQLQAAKKVVQEVLKNKNARALFGQPVDTTVHTGYLKVVKKPIDLGTVLSRLPGSVGAQGGKDKGAYTSVADVLKDVRLVWANCLAYNSTPADEHTRKLCDEARKLFETKWTGAGLSLDADKEATRGNKRGRAAASEPPQPPDGAAGVPPIYFITPGTLGRCRI